MQGSPSDFRLYHSNSLDVLAGLLAAELRQPAPGQSLLTPDTVLIPQVAMRRWLQATLAKQYGVAANLEFLTPGEFVRQALDANVAGEQDDLDAAGLSWRLYAALRDPVVLAMPAMAGMRAYLSHEDPVKPWALANELAGVFEKYQAWRRDWLLRWEAGADPDDPQAILWRRIAGGQSHRARRIQAYLDRHGEPGSALPAGLPARLFAFATLNISPDVLRVIATQGRVGTTHFYLPTPTQAYWGDLQTLGERLRAGVADPFAEAGGESRLLQAWGAAGRDFMAVLGSYEVVHPRGEFGAYAEPGPADAHAPLTLLQQLQRDLFHRNALPSVQRSEVDRQDPSLQVHACHTRLREVQVLHDQLRALLEDERFQPPLQPREIAVLAPDIDPYVPYLEAVFGGQGGQSLPYALADTSALAGEPLADVFLRLLGLPLSRFGLHEMLDLLASPPIAEAAQLDSDALERLRGWLHAAGARWGVDAAHRAQHQAPRDDAYTWAFALERLLLGHASGSEGEIAGVAPWPELEGGSLAALDTLIRLLRVLARQQRTLAEALDPAQWRERLLALLEALIPGTPRDPVAARTLERLRSLINDFADNAVQAGYVGSVPAEVVRSHFAGLLAEADTRAPLLTGGISFGRMVPMRLLPFRAICVLGLNDGDYPRRDPAAGLNRLTAELGSERRRHGDRSTREDDRFLFLQLFASAQDVFYLSYLGADPRDGSVREPSVLVSELIEAAADYHQDRDDAATQMVVRHSLQPFAASAFGQAGEPRRFSYRQNWRPAALAGRGERQRLAPWFDGSAQTPPADETVMPLHQLRRFLMSPAAHYLSQTLALRLPEAAELADDREPLSVAGGGLDRQRLQQAIFQGLLEDPDRDLYPTLRARGLLPSGPLGQRQLQALQQEIAPYAEAFAGWRGDAQMQAPLLAVDVDGVRLQARLESVYPHGYARLRFGELNGPAVIRQGLDWLLASAAGLAQPMVRFHQDEHVGPHPRAPLDPQQAHAALAQLIGLYKQGLEEPLPFAPYSGWALLQARSAESGLKAAQAQWHSEGDRWSEGDDPAWRLALRGRDLFEDEVVTDTFVGLSQHIYGLLLHGGAPA
ncbi:exodeoxyribonuclease V subunit gamma [Pseudoxanthomonas indica]|nr:exodeoxyribonuclease V subunit gamma [Pseudoxanthomonas indica]GGD50529.1 RecBCD enzyme subunit RecC [Pseudoxanthomonas indica]